MNLILSEPLGPGQAEAIEELTMKKRQSKKSKMSQKQILALQKLAQELISEKEQQINQLESRLEQLNETLNEYLTEYESLIAQEKAILGRHNLELFKSKSFNNFHLHEPITKPIISLTNSLDSGVSGLVGD